MLYNKYMSDTATPEWLKKVSVKDEVFVEEGLRVPEALAVTLPSGGVGSVKDSSRVENIAESLKQVFLKGEIDADIALWKPGESKELLMQIEHTFQNGNLTPRGKDEWGAKSVIHGVDYVRVNDDEGDLKYVVLRSIEEK